MRKPRILLLLSLAAVAVVSPPILGQEAEATPQVTLETIIVDPPAPAVDTLCRLNVSIKNTGEETVSQFGFTVKIDDVELPVYINQLFMYPVEPGETTEIPLYNFWSTETSRPAPADGKLRVEVTLREAEWKKIEMEGDTEVWTPIGAVEGLPSTQQLTLEMSGDE